MVHHSKLWYTMDYHCVPWYTTVRLRCVMVYSCTMIYHGLPWFTMVYYGTRWCTMVHHVYHGTPWFTILYHGVSRYHCVRGCTMVYRGFQWYTIVYHGLPCLHHGMAWHTMFAGDLHTRTAVARLPSHQLDYLVVN